MKLQVMFFLLVISIFMSGCFALAEPEVSSGEVAAPTLEAEEALEAAPEAGQEAAAVSETEMSEDSDAATPAPEPTVAEAPSADEAYPGGEAPPTPTAAPTVDPYPAAEESAEQGETEEEAGEMGAEAGGGTAVYEIDPARSEARFTINEVLRGAPKTVVGVSRNLGGQIALDLADPAAAQVGTILINARDFKTDNDFRNNAIANEILLTNQHEFITFEPTAVSGLPQTAEIGGSYELQITGDLTITDQTREVTFDAQVTPLSESELHGLAALDILYADYGLTIPFARAVESVEDNVLLELEFVAARQ